MPLLAPAPLRIAHRGMPRVLRENTLASFALALEHGAQGMELDVHSTADDVVVVHHDEHLASGDAIRSLTHAALLQRSSGYVNIPTLVEVCALIDGRAELFVEIKGDGIERLVESVLTGYAGAVAIHSFDIALIERLARSGTPFRLGVLLPEDGSVTLNDVLRRTGALDVWPHFPLVDAAMVSEVHAAGGRVIPWTVNDRDDARRLTALGVDGICTDDVTMLA